MNSRVLNARDILREVDINKTGGGELWTIQQVIETRIKNFENDIAQLVLQANSGKISFIKWEHDVKKLEEQIKLNKKVVHEVQKLIDEQKRDLQHLKERLDGYSEEELEKAQRYIIF